MTGKVTRLHSDIISPAAENLLHELSTHIETFCEEHAVSELELLGVLYALLADTHKQIAE